MHLAAVLIAVLSAAEPPVSGFSPNPPPEAPRASTTPPEVVAPPSREQRPKVLGLQLAAGFPEGFSLSGILRPLPWLRADAGVAYNVLSFGLEGGVTFAPWSGPVVPTLRLAGGQFFDSDVRDRFGSTFPAAFDPALRRFGYHFFSAQLGLEFGNDDGLLFFARGGLAWVGSSLDSTRYTQGSTTVTADGNELSATTPSLQVGLVWHLW